MFANLDSQAPPLREVMGAIPTEVARAGYDVEHMRLVERREYLIECAFSDDIQQEDIVICEQVQRDLRSRAYDSGRFSAKRENGVYHFQQLVRGFLAK